jgi:hypothetical protein
VTLHLDCFWKVLCSCPAVYLCDRCSPSNIWWCINTCIYYCQRDVIQEKRNRKMLFLHIISRIIMAIQAQCLLASGVAVLCSGIMQSLLSLVHELNKCTMHLQISLTTTSVQAARNVLPFHHSTQTICLNMCNVQCALHWSLSVHLPHTYRFPNKWIMQKACLKKGDTQ